MSPHNVSDNRGLIVSGSGSVSFDVGAIGDGASAVKNVHTGATTDESALATIRQQLQELTALMQQHGDRVQPETRAAVEQVANEAAKPKPNKLVMSSVLQGAAATVGSIAALGAHILKIKDLISLL
jgi:hypothetical protein